LECGDMCVVFFCLKKGCVLKKVMGEEGGGKKEDCLFVLGGGGGGGERGGNNNKNIRQIININSVSNVSLCTDPEFHGLLHIWMVHSVCIHGDDHRLIINYQRLKNFSPRPAHQYIYTARK